MNQQPDETAYAERKEQIDKFIEAVCEIAKKIIEALKPIVDMIIYWAAKFSSYPDKNVIRLALYAKKRRIREKNKAKIFSWIAEANYE